MKEKNKTSLSLVALGIFVLIVVPVMIISAIEDELSELSKDKNDKYEYKDDKVIFTEAKYLFGSIFNKNTLVLSDDNVEIFSCSFFGEKKTVRPYNTLKEVTFSNAFFGYYKVVIESQGGFWGNEASTFYFNQKDTFDLLKTVIKHYSKNRCVITESL